MNSSVNLIGGRELTEDEKRKFDAWESIRDHAWREFENKSRAEWRLSFGIWAALLASASALIASHQPLAVNLMKEWSCALAFLAFAILLGHFYFLYWIQTRLQEARESLSEAQGAMRHLLEDEKPQPPRSIWEQVPMYVEGFITILLIVVLYVVLKYSGC
jgi:small-conductance mechanosensitive channel